MNPPVVFLALVDLALIGALPRVFFRKGRLNAAWWMTAAPFLVTSGVLTAALAGLVSPSVGPARLFDAAAVLLLSASILLIGATLGTHRAPLSLWHQPDDAPRHLVMEGPYSRVRHPFYTAFLLGLTGCAAAFPHWLTLAALCFAAVRLDRTAAREERTLRGSAFGARYERYMLSTGRFIPRLAVGGRGSAGGEGAGGSGLGGPGGGR